MAQSATTAIFIDKYHPKADGKCAVSIRVTFDRKKKYYPTPLSLSIDEFEKTQGAKPREPYKGTSLRLQAFEKKAADIIRNMSVFTWKGFERQYLVNRGAKGSVFQGFADYSKELREAGRIGTAVSYECAQSSLNKFDSGLKFADVTPDILRKYEAWMLSKGNSITSVGIYLRSLRTLFNNAIAEGMLTKELYPFGKKKYEIPSGRNMKKALTLLDIELIYNFKADSGSMSERAKDYWIFMYLCNGINVKDLCLLKYENINGDILEFERAKTVRTKRAVEPIRVVITEDVKAIIEKWGNQNRDGKNYIFPILSNGLTPERERQLIQQLTQVINGHMKSIAKKLEITNDATTYAARHSFATILQRSGVSTEFICEALGHGNIRTTQSYLAGFEDIRKREVVKALTAFKKPAI
jgi:integrase/recombinase XerD